MGQYFLVYFSPAGRISQVAYFFYMIPVAILVGSSCYFLSQLDDLNPYLLGLLFFALWSQYCLMSRRLQDCGIPGAVVLPLLIMSVFNFLVWLDPSIMGETAESFEENWAMLSIAMYVVARITGMVTMYAFVKGSDEGPNGFGQPFGSMGKMSPKKQKQIRDRVMAEHGNTAAGRVIAQAQSTQRLAQVYADTTREEVASPRRGIPREPRRTGFGQR